MTISVVIADDQNLIRAGLRSVLENATDMKILGEASNGHQAVQLVSMMRPDVVLMDIRMPEMDGIDATARIAADGVNRQTKVIAMTTFELDEYAYRSIRVGASGVAQKNASPPELLSAIRAVAHRDSLPTPKSTIALIEEFSEPQRIERVSELAPVQTEVLREIGKGRSNAEVAQELGLGIGQLSEIYDGLLHVMRVRDRVHLAIIAFESGLS